MICHAMDRLLHAGVERFIINTHHCCEAYTAAFPTASWRGKPLLLVHEPTLLDTGGGLKNIEPFLEPDEHHLLVCNADIFAAPDYARLCAAHDSASGAEVTLLLRSTGSPRNVRFRSASGGSGTVLDMRGRLGATAGVDCLFSGIYCMSRKFFAALQPGKVESVVEAFLRRIAAAPGSICGLLDDTGPWHDLGTVDEYHRVCAEYAR
jgi:NDP-sugar pyrophosphorylase family protein